MNNKVQYFDQNSIGQDYIIGDIHGCLSEVKNLMQFVSFDKRKDRLFSVGDLVDRGPDSLGALRLVKESWFFPVLGNHEQMMLDSLAHKPGYRQHLENWVINGGNWHRQLDDKEFAELEELCEYVKELPLVISIGKDTDSRMNIVHAELNIDKNFDQTTDEDIDDWFFDENNEINMVWGRQVVQLKHLHKAEREGLSLTVAGHTPITTPIKVLSHMFIDTGACYWHKQQYEEARLTMYRISDGKFFSLQVNSGIVTEF